MNTLASPRFLRRIILYVSVMMAACGTAQSQIPTITIQPKRVAPVAFGGSVTLSVTANNTTSYQWKRNGLPIAGATAASYAIVGAIARDNGWAHSRINSKNDLI